MKSAEQVQHTFGKRSPGAFQWYAVHLLQTRITEAVEWNVNRLKKRYIKTCIPIHFATQVTGHIPPASELSENRTQTTCARDQLQVCSFRCTESVASSPLPRTATTSTITVSISVEFYPRPEYIGIPADEIIGVWGNN